jgi:putative transposase
MSYLSGPRKRNRLPDYDYSSIGGYFLTIRLRSDILMGRVVKGKMVPNKLGTIVIDAWCQIPLHYRDVRLDEFMIMPDHIHGIIFVENNIKNSGLSHYALVSKVVKSFKESVTKTVRRDIPESDFKWQRSFYDHIIRDEAELNAIRKYIIENPIKWNTK